MNRRLFPVLISSLVLPAAAFAQEKVTFQDHVQPIFRQHCGSCHNTDKKTADLDPLS